MDRGIYSWPLIHLFTHILCIGGSTQGAGLLTGSNSVSPKDTLTQGQEEVGI